MLRTAELIFFFCPCILISISVIRYRRGKNGGKDWRGIRLGLMSCGACLLISDVKQHWLYLLSLSARSINSIFSDMKREHVSSVKWKGARGKSRQCPFSFPILAGVICLVGRVWRGCINLVWLLRKEEDALLGRAEGFSAERGGRKDMVHCHHNFPLKSSHTLIWANKPLSAGLGGRCPHLLGHFRGRYLAYY